MADLGGAIRRGKGANAIRGQPLPSPPPLDPPLDKGTQNKIERTAYSKTRVPKNHKMIDMVDQP